MVNSQESYIIANFVAKLKLNSPLSCESLPEEAVSFESNADVGLFGSYIECSRVDKIRRCALDAFAVIRELSHGFADFQWNPGLKPLDISNFKVIYPILRASLDCLLNQIPNINNLEKSDGDNYDNLIDSSTLTFEGLFLLVKTSLEFIHPLAYSSDGSILSQLVSLLERSAYSVYLLNSNLACLASYLSRLYIYGYIIKIPENQEMILRQHSVIFRKVISLAISGNDKSVDAYSLLFLRRVICSILYIVNNEVGDKSQNINEELVIFMTRFVDVWYCSLVKFLVNTKNPDTNFLPVKKLSNLMSNKSSLDTSPATTSDPDLSKSSSDGSDDEDESTPDKSPNDQSSQKQSPEMSPVKEKDLSEILDSAVKIISKDRDLMLAKICKLISETPKLPPSHRMRLIFQMVVLFMETNNNDLELEALNAILLLMDFSRDTKNSRILKSNLLPLLKLLSEVLTRKVEDSGVDLVNVVDPLEVEKYLVLACCLGQILRNLLNFKFENDPENLDEFLQNQIKQIDQYRNNKDLEEDGDLELEPSEHDLEINEPDFSLFEMITKVMKLFTQLLSLNDDSVDETIGVLTCWMLKETKFEQTLKFATPISCIFLKTKKARMLEVMSGRCGSYTSTPQIATSTTERWLYGTRIFKTALDCYIQVKDDLKQTDKISPENETDKYQESDMLVRSLLTSMLDSLLEVMVESLGKVSEEIEECLSLYFTCFGIEDYMKRLPLDNLYKIPITSERYQMDSYIFMIPVLKKLLKGFKLSFFPKYVLPILSRLDFFVNKTSQFKVSKQNGVGDLRSQPMNNSFECQDLNVLAVVHKKYEDVYNHVLQLLIPLSHDEDAIDVLLEQNYLLLKFIVSLLDRGPEKFNIACRVISNLVRLEKVAIELIGILVKKFVHIENLSEKNLDSWNMCDNVLMAIANVARFCPSETLSRNLESFEKALGGKRTDSLIKLSKSLIPSVTDDLKYKLYINFMTQPKNRFIYLAVKAAIESAHETLEKNPEILTTLKHQIANPVTSNGLGLDLGLLSGQANLNNTNETHEENKTDKSSMDVDSKPTETTNSNHVQDNHVEKIDGTTKFVKLVVSPVGMMELARFLELLSENVDTTKQRISCLHSYAKLLHYLKNLFPEGTYTNLIHLVTKPLIFECIINSYSQQKINRSSSFSIYYLLCELNSTYDDVLKITLSTMYFNHNNIKQDCESINIGIVKLLCYIYSRCYDKFDNFETIRLVIYLTTRLNDESCGFYIRILKFFRIIMVNMNYESLLKVTPNIMRLFQNEKCCNKARIYVKRLVEKMLVRLSREYLFSIFPKKHFPLLSNVILTKRRKLNKELYSTQKGGTHKATDEFEDDDDETIILKDENEEIKELREHLERKKKKVVKQKHKDYSYIRLNRKIPKKEQLKVLKGIMKNKNKK